MPYTPTSPNDAKHLYSEIKFRLVEHVLPPDRIQEFCTMLYYWEVDPLGDYRWNNETDLDIIREFLAGDPR